MSTYTSNAARVAQARALQEAIRRRRQTAQARAAADQLTRAQSALLAGLGSAQITALAEQVDLRLSHSEVTPDELRTSLQPLGDHAVFRPVLEATTPVGLGLALNGAAQTLAVAERVVVADVLHDTLFDLYDHVDRFDGDDGTGFTAQRGNELIVIGVADGGGITTDQVGALDCQSNHEAVMNGVRERGIELTDTESAPHDPDVEGTLVRRARALGGTNLAMGAAKASARKQTWREETALSVGRQVAQ